MKSNLDEIVSDLEREVADARRKGEKDAGEYGKWVALDYVLVDVIPKFQAKIFVLERDNDMLETTVAEMETKFRKVTKEKSEELYIRFDIFKHAFSDGEYYTAWIHGVNGTISNWDAFEELRLLISEDGYSTHPNVKPILMKYDHERDGAITMLAKLELIKEERQLGTGEGDVIALPEYYDIVECEELSFERLTV
ncbi:hypothetical protein MO973_19505 [Paenibacillus sp. TRM 82003]|nr:hypothetical protein [Paenibacillus sp. TRM 82003]